MALTLGRPGSLLGRVSICGTPYHGLVQGGVLPLPNASVMDYPQPGGSMPDQRGSTHMIRVPGVPDVVRTGTQAELDLANGYQWRDVAMLSGGDFQLYGKALGGWIYIDPAGDRWRVTTSITEDVLHRFDEPYTCSIVLSRFGVFSAGATVPETYVHMVSFSDWQQAGEELYWHDNSVVDRAQVHLHSIRPDGSAASLMLHRRAVSVTISGQSQLDAFLRYPLGWAQIAISGPGSAASVSMSIIRSREQTIQVGMDSSLSGGEFTGGYFKSAGDAYGFLVPGPNQNPLPPPGYSAGSSHFNVKAVSGTQTRSGSVIVAMWPGEDAWIDVRLELAYTRVLDVPVPEVPAGPSDFQRSGTNLETFSLVVSAGGTPIASATATMTSSFNQSVFYAPGNSYGGDWSVTDASGSIADHAWSGSVESGTDPTAIATGMQFPPDFTTLDSRGGFSSPFSKQAMFLAGGGIHGLRYGPGGAPQGLIWFELIRYSNNLLAPRIIITPPGQPTTSAIFPAASPSGAHGAITHGSYDKNARLYGSWCPHTHAAEVAATSPVCWV